MCFQPCGGFRESVKHLCLLNEAYDDLKNRVDEDTLDAAHAPEAQTPIE